MPQIKEYQQQVEPNATAPGKRVYPDAFETMPHNAGAGATALGEVLQREQEQTDTSNVHVMMAQARADWTNHLAQAAQGAATDVTADQGYITKPNGQENGDGKPVLSVNVGNFSDKYMGDLSTYLTQAKQNVTTQAGSRLYDAMAANLHADLQEKAVGAQAHLTGLKAVADYNGALNNYRNVLLNDPSQFASVLKEASTGLGSWVEIPADQRIKLMEQTGEKLALSAVQGWIKIDPEGAAKQLQDGQWDNYLSAAGKYQLEHQAQLGINMQATEARRQELAEAREQAKARMETNDGFMGKFVAGELTMEDVRGSNLNPFGEGSQNTWREMIDQQNKAGIGNMKSNKAAVMQAYHDIHRPAGDPHKMTNEDTLNAGFGTYWNEHDLLFLRKEMQDDRTPDGQRLGEIKSSFFKAMKPQLDKSTLLGNDPVGAEQAYKYQMFVENLVEQAKAKHENEYDLFNPKSKDYVGQYLHLFQRSITEQVQDYSRGIPKPVTSTASPPPEVGAPGQGMPHIEASPLPADDKRLPGETAEQWRKRTGH